MKLLGWQPVIRLDYRPTQNLRGNFKYQQYQQPNKSIPGIIPGLERQHAGRLRHLHVVGRRELHAEQLDVPRRRRLGRNTHHQEGCSIVGGDPNWCITGDPVNAIANRITAGFGAIPYLFPDATIIDPSTRSYEILNNLGDRRRRSGTARACRSRRRSRGAARRQRAAEQQRAVQQLHPRHRVGQRERDADEGQRPSHGQDGLLLLQERPEARHGRHLRIDQLRERYEQPARLVVRVRQRGARRLQLVLRSCRAGAKARSPSINHEVFIQDNWKVTPHADARLRRALRPPGAELRRLPDSLELLPGPVDDGERAAAVRARLRHRRLSLRGGEPPGDGSGDRPVRRHQRRRPASSSARSCRDTGSTTNGLQSGRQGHCRNRLHLPDMGYAPRFGAAWDVQGNQKFVVRGGAGLFFDRPPANSIYGTVNNPPFVAERHGAVRLPAEPQQRRPDDRGAAVADRVRVRQQAAVVRPVERRHADGCCRSRAPSTCPTRASTATTRRRPPT